MNKIPNTLLELRKKANLKQSDVARELGFKSSARISKWEKGLTYPHVRNLRKLARLYKVSQEDLYK